MTKRTICLLMCMLILASAVPFNMETVSAAEGGSSSGKTVSSGASGPTVTGWHRKSRTSMELTWKTTTGADGYEIQICPSSDSASGSAKAFSDRSKVTTLQVSDAGSSGKSGTQSVRVTRLEENVSYAVRIRSVWQLSSGSDAVPGSAAVPGDRKVSKWSIYKGKKSNIRTSAKLLRKKGKVINWHRYLPLRYRYKYRVLQGSATDGTNLYLIYEPASGNKCVILKVNLKNKKFVRVSKPLVLDHGNDMTYNPDTKQLYVVHWDGHPYRVTAVDAKTLKITKKKTVRVPKSLDGASAKQLKAIAGYAGITYNRVRKQYALRISGANSFLLLDSKLRPVKFIRGTKTSGERPQSLDSDADYIYSCMDAVGKYNVMLVYDWDGNYQYKVRIPKIYEIQGIFQRKGRFYANFYDGRYRHGVKTRRSYTCQLGFQP